MKEIIKKVETARMEEEVWWWKLLHELLSFMEGVPHRELSCYQDWSVITRERKHTFLPMLRGLITNSVLSYQNNLWRLYRTSSSLQKISLDGGGDLAHFLWGFGLPPLLSVFVNMYTWNREVTVQIQIHKLNRHEIEYRVWSDSPGIVILTV